MQDRVELFIAGKPHRETRDSSHIITNCPYCEKPYHLYLNRETGAWDCKRCGESGGIQKLLKDANIPYELPDLTKQAQKLHDNLALHPKVKEYLEGRGLGELIDTRKYGFSMEKTRISIPYWQRGKVVQIRYRSVNGSQHPKYLSDPGAPVMLYNMDSLFDVKKSQAIVTEGEFDADITADRMPEWAVVGVPGANNFRPDWGRYFSRFKRVLICLDAGEVGHDGAVKIKRHIPHAEIVRFPEGLPDGFDLTNYFLSDKELPSLEAMVESEVRDLIPETGFIRDYLEYCRPLTDAPDAFHLFNALGLLSTCIGRRAHMVSFGGHALYPNLWLVLLAPSSFYRKTTALNISKIILASIEGVTIYPSEFSREALQETIADNPHGVFIWYEFGGILGLLGREYMTGTKDFLSDLYDCLSDINRKLKGRSFDIKDAYVNIMSATSLDWLKEKIKAQDIRGGFLARFIYVPISKKERFIAIPADPDMMLRNRLVKFLQKLTEHKPVQFTNKHLRADFTDFSQATEREIIGTPYEATLAPFFSRLEAYLWKLSMLYELSLGNKGPEISPEAFYWAMSVVDYLKGKLKSVIGEEFEMEGDPKLRRVLKLIKDSPGLTRRELMQKTGYLARNMGEYLGSLRQSGQIIEKREGKTERFYHV